MSEQEIQRKRIKELESEGYYVLKLTVTNKNGIPDLIAIPKDADVLFIECKKGKGKLSELQKYCRNANIFKYPYQMGYVAAFLSKGMSSEFFLNLSEDLRKTFNLIFKNYQLTQAWIFKYENNKLCQVDGFDKETSLLNEGNNSFDTPTEAASLLSAYDPKP